MTAPALPMPAVPNVPRLPGGNTSWAARYGALMREVHDRQADRQPRSLQVHLGPSEVGSVCDRQIVGKMTGAKHTNHVTSRWPATVGTGVHVQLAQFFANENLLNQDERWHPEIRVVPVPEHAGTSDLYDALEYAAVDHKALGETQIAKLRRRGPSTQYFVQLLLYAKGLQNQYKRVDRIVLVAWPRTAPTLAGMYVWEHVLTQDDDIIISQWLSLTRWRAEVASRILAGQLRIEDVPFTPNDGCAFCSQFRPEAAQELARGLQPGPGCPGNSLRR